MVVQALLDSLSRCFGAAQPNQEQARPREVATATGRVATAVQPQPQRRSVAVGLELQDEEWDALFDADGNKVLSQKQSPARATANVELEYAQVLAKAKQAANPSRHRTPTKRKGGPSSRKADIFRSRAFEASRDTASQRAPAGNSFSRFLSHHEGVAKALCFANPIRDKDDEPPTTVVRSSDTSAGNTLNTCEDTITSTLYFDAKYSHVVENRPPMPLFNHFKVDTEGGKADELRRIVATDSHNSLKMMRLFQEEPQMRGNQVLSNQVLSSDESDDEQEPSKPTIALSQVRSKRGSDDDEDIPPPVTLVSDSSSRSHSTAPSTPSSSRSMSSRERGGGGTGGVEL